MRLGEMLERCLGLERRAADMYRRFAARLDPGDELHEVWIRLAAEEDEHAAQLAAARTTAAPEDLTGTRIDGWDEAAARVEAVLSAAEAASPATPDAQLALALDLEGTEIDLLRQVLVAEAGPAHRADGATSRHARELADVAARYAGDSRLRLKEAIVRARERLGGHGS